MGSLILQLSEGRGGLSPCPVPPVLFPDPLLRPSGMLSSLPLWLLLLPCRGSVVPATACRYCSCRKEEEVPPPARNHPRTDLRLPCRGSVVPAAARPYCPAGMRRGRGSVQYSKQSCHEFMKYIKCL